MCLEFVPAGVSCLCPYDNMLPIGPVNLTHTHTHTHWMDVLPGWMDVLPTKDTWELDAATVKSALRGQKAAGKGTPLYRKDHRLCQKAA